MNDERQAFLDAIRQDPADATLRLMYADWLEERGEADEAAKQRAWPEAAKEARAWLTAFGRRVGGRRHYDGPPSDPLTCDQLLGLAVDEAEGRYNPLSSMGTNEDYKDVTLGEWDEFWARVEVLTGRRSTEGGGVFSCGC